MRHTSAERSRSLSGVVPPSFDHEKVILRIDVSAMRNGDISIFQMLLSGDGYANVVKYRKDHSPSFGDLPTTE